MPEKRLAWHQRTRSNATQRTQPSPQRKSPCDAGLRHSSAAGRFSRRPARLRADSQGRLTQSGGPGDMAKRRVLVTGASGYIAAQLLPALRERYELLLLDRRTEDRQGRPIPGIQVADLTNPDLEANR